MCTWTRFRSACATPTRTARSRERWRSSGEKWSLLVLREAFFGLRRFDDFHRALGCARNLLSERLAKLVEYGVLERVAYREPGQRTPPRVPADREGARPGADARRADAVGRPLDGRRRRPARSRSATAGAAARSAPSSRASTATARWRRPSSRRSPVRARASTRPNWACCGRRPVAMRRAAPRANAGRTAVAAPL